MNNMGWFQDSVLVILKRILENQVQIKQDIYRLNHKNGLLPYESVYRDSHEHDIGILKDIDNLLGIEDN